MLWWIITGTPKRGAKQHHFFQGPSLRQAEPFPARLEPGPGHGPSTLSPIATQEYQWKTSPVLSPRSSLQPGCGQTVKAEAPVEAMGRRKQKQHSLNISVPWESPSFLDKPPWQCYRHRGSQLQTQTANLPITTRFPFYISIIQPSFQKKKKGESHLLSVCCVVKC